MKVKLSFPRRKQFMSQFFKIIAIGGEILHQLENLVSGQTAEFDISYKGQKYHFTIKHLLG